MEIVVTVVVGLLGAIATIFGAYIQRGRSKEEERASEAKFAVTHPPTNQASNTFVSTTKIPVTLIFPGSSAFHESRRTSFGYINVSVDGEHVGSGSGDRGFKIEFTTTEGLHDIAFMWDKDFEGNTRISTTQYRSEIEVVFSGRSPSILRFGFRMVNQYSTGEGRFYIRRIEPRLSGYVPLSRKTAIGLVLGGIAAIILSVLILWAVLSAKS